MRGPNRREDHTRDHQREIVKDLRGGSAVVRGQHGQDVSASVVDQLKRTYQNQVSGHRELAVKVAGAHKFDPPRLEESMAEAARHGIAGRLDFRHAVHRVDAANQRAKEELRDHLVSSYRGKAREVAGDLGEAMRAVDKQAPDRTVAIESRVRAADLRAERAIGVLKSTPGSTDLGALGGEAHAQAVLARIYAGREVLEARSQEPMATAMLAKANSGPNDQPWKDSLDSKGDLQSEEARRWIVAPGEGQMNPEMERRWAQALATIAKHPDVPTEGEARVEAIGGPDRLRSWAREHGADEVTATELEGVANGLQGLREGASDLENLDLSTKEGRNNLWNHLVDVDPEKAQDRRREELDLATFKAKALWNDETTIRMRAAGAAMFYLGRGSFRMVRSLEGVGENLLHALQAMAEMQDHAARGAAVGLAGAMWRAGAHAMKAPVDGVTQAASHASDAVSQARDTGETVRRRSQQSMGIFVARHEMSQRMAELAQNNVREGLEITYGYCRSFQAAAEARQGGMETSDPMERQAFSTKEQLARREMNVHLTRLRVEHPEFHQMVMENPVLSPEGVDRHLDGLSDPRVSAGAAIANANDAAGLSQGSHGDWSPVADLGNLSDGRRMVATTQDGWVEVAALDEEGRGERLGRARAEDFETLRRVFSEEKRASPGELPAMPGGLNPAQAQGWDLVARMDQLASSGQQAAVGELAGVSSALHGNTHVLSSRNPSHQQLVDRVNDVARAADSSAVGIPLKAEVHIRNQMAEVNRATREVTYKNPLELQAFLERVVAMRAAEDSVDASMATEATEATENTSDYK